VQAGSNLGFATANNLAASHVTSKTAHILLLNPDTEIRKTDIGVLLSSLDDATVGIAGPRLRNPDGSAQQSVRAFPSVQTFLWLFFKLHRVLATPAWRRYMQLDFNYDAAATVDQVMGAAFLVRRSAWDALAGLDAGFFVWFEEVDFCKRAKARGFSTMYTPATSVVHYGGVSFNQLVGWRRTKPWVMSSLRYIRKHLTVWLPLFLVLAPAALALAIPAGVAHRQMQKANKKRL